MELQRNPPPSTDPNTRVFTLRGSAQQMDVARQLIDDKIGVGGRRGRPGPGPSGSHRCPLSPQGSGIISNGGFGFSPFTQAPSSHQR